MSMIIYSDVLAVIAHIKIVPTKLTAAFAAAAEISTGLGYGNYSHTAPPLESPTGVNGPP